MWTDDLFKGYITVRYSGADLTPRRTIEFVGATVADDASTGRTVVTIPSQWPEGLIGSLLYHNGSAWVELAAGDAGDVLTLGVAGPSPIPTWEAPSGGELPAGEEGDILYHDGTGWATLSKGDPGDVLTMPVGTSTPRWSPASAAPATGSWYSLVSLCVSGARAPETDNGGYSVGCRFTPRWDMQSGQTLRCTGARFYAKFGAYPRTVKCKLHDDSSETPLASGSVTVSADGVAEVTWATPVTFAASQYGKPHTISMYETSDTDGTRAAYEVIGTYFYASPFAQMMNENLYDLGDVRPTTQGVKSYPVEAILTTA